MMGYGRYCVCCLSENRFVANADRNSARHLQFALAFVDREGHTRVQAAVTSKLKQHDADVFHVRTFRDER
jgi:hypothetical protein